MLSSRRKQSVEDDLRQRSTGGSFLDYHDAHSEHSVGRRTSVSSGSRGERQTGEWDAASTTPVPTRASAQHPPRQIVGSNRDRRTPTPPPSAAATTFQGPGIGDSGCVVQGEPSEFVVAAKDANGATWNWQVWTCLRVQRG